MKKILKIFVYLISIIILSNAVTWTTWFILLSIIEGKFAFNFELEVKGLKFVYLTLWCLVISIMINRIEIEV